MTAESNKPEKKGYQGMLQDTINGFMADYNQLVSERDLLLVENDRLKKQVAHLERVVGHVVVQEIRSPEVVIESSGHITDASEPLESDTHDGIPLNFGDEK